MILPEIQPGVCLPQLLNYVAKPKSLLPNACAQLFIIDRPTFDKMGVSFVLIIN